MHATAKTALFVLLLLTAGPSTPEAAGPTRLDGPLALRFGGELSLPVDKRELRERLAPVATRRPAAASLLAADGALALSSAAVSLRLDAFGSFGSSTSGTDAFFDDGNRRAGTVFEYMVHARGLGFLDGDSLLLPQDRVRVERVGSAVLATYELGAFAFEVRSELMDCDQPHCAWLVQDWSITNIGADDRPLELTPYLDGDLFFSGDFGNDYGARSADSLYQFDSGSDPTAPSTYLGLDTDAPAALRIVREVGEYSEQRRRIRAGGLLVDGFRRADGRSGDADGDGVTDQGFDVSLAASHDFGTLAPGETVHLQVRVQWGLGAIADLAELAPDAGEDLVVECEGQSGTLVRLDGSGSEPADLLVAHRWLLGGELVAEGVVADILLPTGEHLLVLEVEDGEGRRATDELVITVIDTVEPQVEVLSPLVLWPPNHQLVEIVPPVRLFDDCSESVSLHLIAVLVDEPAEVGAGGDGHTESDVLLTDDGRLFLRAERQGGGDGRVYRVLARAMDDAANGRTFAFEVHVPHAPNEPAIRSSSVTVVRFH